MRGMSEKTRGMFSVVIPTLQRAGELQELVERCAAHSIVLEVLVINNAPAPLAWEYPKVRVLQQAENIYVNPAWNLGAREARGEYLAIVNDDVLFDTSLFNRAARWLRLPFVGIVGPDPSCFTASSGDRVWFRPVYSRRYGYGTCMLMRRDRYVPIPEEMLIYAGDDWLFTRQCRRNWTFGGFPIATDMAVTSRAPEFSPVSRADLDAYARHGAGDYRDRFAREERLVAAASRAARVVKARARAS